MRPIPSDYFITRLASVFLLLCFTVTAQAGLFDDAEARKEIQRLRSDINSLGNRIDGAKFEQANSQEALRAEIARIRGQLEVLNNRMDNIEKRQSDFYVDLDTRLRALEGNKPLTSSAKKNKGNRVTIAPSQSYNKAAELSEYQRSLHKFKARDYQSALTGFQALIRNYPDGELVPSSYFWAGSSQYQLGDFGASSALFAKLVRKWPNHQKAPDALYAKADAEERRGKKDKAMEVLQDLVNRYPTSKAATKGRQKLRRMARSN